MVSEKDELDMCEVVPSNPSSKKTPSNGAIDEETGAIIQAGKAWEGDDKPEERSARASHGRVSAVQSDDKRRAKMWRLATVRSYLAKTRWYKSTTATHMRKVAQGKVWASFMAVCLVLALFMPDVWVLTGVNDNTFIDITLTVVMVFFFCELVLLSSVDASYVLSFFFFMDVVGTISMMFDISFMEGHDVTRAQTWEDLGSGQVNYMLLRAARAAKLGARAGRLSRFVRLLRFLPLVTGGRMHDKIEPERQGIASTISEQLTNVVATRVASLTIVLVMVVPVFDVWTFPSNDHSLTAWVERLSRHEQSGRQASLASDLQTMVSFYAKQSFPNYGPYRACIGERVGGDENFRCVQELTGDWSPEMASPPRGRSAINVYTDTFLVGFNMHETSQLQAILNMMQICFIILVMVFSGLALSNVVTELAVRPLERMLGIVRDIASTVFNLSTEVDNEHQEEVMDINHSSEIKLLEKVVNKLAIIVDLDNQKHDLKTEDMQDEDVGIMNMMLGKNVLDVQEQDRRSVAVVRKRGAVQPVVCLEDFGVSQEVFNSFAFTPIPLTKGQRCKLVVFTVAHFHTKEDGYVSTSAEEATLQRFVTAAEKEYLPNPFHSWAHAIDVLQCVVKIMRLISSESFLSELEQFVLLISAVSHDLGHFGVNNAFLSEVGHELALQYNDRSPLENMHCAKLYSIVAQSDSNVFAKMSKEAYREARQHSIEMILHTDMVGHQAMVKDLQLFYQMNSETFEFPEATGATPEEQMIFQKPDTKKLIMDCILHSADVSNPCRTWEVTQTWAHACLEEFFAQGDQEKMLGIPVQFLNDRDKLNRPNSQIGFIEFMIAPFFAAQIFLWPQLKEFGENLATNIEHWEDLFAKEMNPTDEDRAKVTNRVVKVRQTMENAATRDGHIASGQGA